MGALGLGITTLHPNSIFASKSQVPFNESKIKLSLAAYSFRDYFKSGELTMEGFIDYCDKLKLDGTELTSYYFESEEDAYFLKLKNKWFHL
jgi:predicted nucleotidyltransferase